jgi:hypothetical protein
VNINIYERYNEKNDYFNENDEMRRYIIIIENFFVSDVFLGTIGRTY